MVPLIKLLETTYEPWFAQRQFHRSPKQIRCVVAGRQSGKTHSAAEEVIKIIAERPGSTSCLLMPTYKSTKGAMKHIERALKPLGNRVRYYKTDAVYRFANGAELYVRTADDKSGVPTRGLTVDGVLWVDEAAYVPSSAWDAARLTQSAVKDPLVILTSTPCGKNWFYDEWHSGWGRSPITESFRFRTIDSPYHNPSFVEDLKKKLGPKRAMQELNAEFLGDAITAFNVEDIDAIFSDIPNVRGEQRTLGIDLAKERDWTVITLMNEFGEAWILGRWRKVGWPEQEARITELARKHDALCVVDLGHGGGYGGNMYDYLARNLGESRLLGVRTGNLGVKGQVIEALAADVENRRVSVAKSDNATVLRHEMTYFEAHRNVVAGVERWKYHGPEKSVDGGDDDDDIHDDCVISLSLANWGRIHGWEGDPTHGDFSGFTPTTTTPSQGGFGGFGGNFNLGWSH